MPRKKRVYKKNWRPDPQFNSILVGRFVGYVMERGKRSKAQKVISETFEIIHERTKRGGLNVFEQALKNVSPLMELKGKRIGGANYQVPIPVMGDRRVTLAMRWIKAAAKSRKGKGTADCLAEELIEASQKKGVAMKKREDTHRMAEANKAFAHFA